MNYYTCCIEWSTTDPFQLWKPFVEILTYSNQKFSKSGHTHSTAGYAHWRERNEGALLVQGATGTGARRDVIAEGGVRLMAATHGGGA